MVGESIARIRVGVSAIDVEQELEKLFEKIMKVMMSTLLKTDGGQEFELNVENENGPMIIKAADSIAKRYSVVRPISDV
jgi:hypothetical protein